MKIVVFGLSVTSSWGNGHATTYRGLMRGLHARGHRITFLERNLPWYESNRDLRHPLYCDVHLYSSVRGMKRKFRDEVMEADLVIVGSYVPDGIEIGRWVTKVARGVTAFYDIDTPVTIGKLERGESDYIAADLISRYDMYLSFTGGPTLRRIEQKYGARRARPLYCAVDPTVHLPENCALKWDLGYMGTYSADRQPPLNELMLDAARQSSDSRMVVAGSQYPQTIVWPENVERIEHLSPDMHRRFYGSQRFTLNLTRAEMRHAGYSPSVRLFEAAACGTAIISDEWQGLEVFFRPGREILVTRSVTNTLEYLHELSERERVAIGIAARKRVLQEHTSIHRAIELETFVEEVVSKNSAVRTALAHSPTVPPKVAGQFGD